jgi:phosphatidylserine/phosphatidylglycerophosphate/cardiolipin synthase-like enzyme
VIEAVNTGSIPVHNYVFQLYLTEGLALAESRLPHALYTPPLTQAVDVPPGRAQRLTVPLYVFEEATRWQGVALVHQEEVVGRLTIPVGPIEDGVTGDAGPQSDYQMPDPPAVSCTVSPPPLSTIGFSVTQALETYYNGADGYFSGHTQCNEVAGDWILDVPNVITESDPPEAEAKAFYTQTADLIRGTRYTFTFSTLGFNTHEESGEENLVQAYLAPAILELHNSTPAYGPYPLLRFLYADFDLGHDSEEEVYADLTARLSEVEPDSSQWRVSIAVATIGDIDYEQLQPSPWNHSKIAVQDYRQAIVGGMNWELNYVRPFPLIDDRITHPLFDLSLQMEGEAAQAAGVYLDRVWRRNIDPLFPHLGNDCETSWPKSIFWAHDCPLDAVPHYAPNGNQIPDYSLDGAYHVFGLGRGHTEWLPIGNMDASADEAVLTAFAAAEASIYVSQRQLTSTLLPLQFTPEVRDALIEAVLRDVSVRIALSEPWGVILLPETPEDIYHALQEELYARAVEEYENSPDPQAEIDKALCRLELGPFHVPYYPYPETNNHLYYTHNKFFMIDEKVFYVGSQNLYPSGIGNFSGPELNEYGYLVDDAVLTIQMRTQYWDPVWQQTGDKADAFQPLHLSEGKLCKDGVLVSTGLQNPTANAADSGGDNNGYNKNPGNAQANDSVFAIDNNSGTGTQTSCTHSRKDKHRFYNYNFSIPGGAMIQGIEVRLDARADSASGAPKLCVQLSWNGGASWTSAKSTTTLGTSEQTFILGSATDTWGHTWTASELSNANFRVRIINVASNTSRDFSLDWVAINVYHQP